MNQGKFLEQGTHGELLVNNGLYRQVFDLQNKQAERKAAARAIWGEA